MFLVIYDNSPMPASTFKHQFSELSTSAISQDITALVDIGYITRTVEGYDNRIKSYELSDRGFDAVDEWMAACLLDNPAPVYPMDVEQNGYSV